MKRARSTARNGFTLWELVTVTVITVVLFGFWLPLGPLQGHGSKRLTCQSNLKQIGNGLLMYAEDYDQVLPPHAKVSGGVTSRFSEFLEPYIKNPRVFRCPSDERNRGLDAPPEASPISVGYNWLALSPMGQPLSLEQVGAPMSTVAAVDAAGYAATPTRLVEAFSGSAPAYRHDYTANVLWLDGHVKMFQYSRDLEATASTECGRILRSGIDSYSLWNVDSGDRP